ncbi:PKD domain-containing protein, partial [Ilumatobacter sp.]|uniref:cadherin-like domain-containing protein n=1 Tax=Ilumatobacter sp. TaxID=1967498 RepID=UPI003AF97FA8
MLSGSKNKLLGGTEYVNRIRLTGQNNLIDPAATKVVAREAPVTFDIAGFRPGGAVANAAGADYVDHSAECGAPGQPAVLHLRRDELSRGLHYAPCDVVLTDALSHQPTTIVADGKIKVTGSTSELGPAYVDGLQLFSDSTSKNAIKIAGNWADVDGVVYAPRGQVTVAGEGHEFRCAVVASRVAIKGAKHTFTGDADCGNIPPGNTPPIAIDDTYSVDEDDTLTIVAPGVLGNDTDADGDPLTAVLVDDVANGTLTIDGAGEFTYAPDADFAGDDTFTYVANDGTDDSNTATVTITVNPVNDPPVADANGPYSALAGETITFDGSGSSDPDGTIDSFDWDFGDGSTGTGVAPTHSYTEAGTFTVTLTVTDDGGLFDTTTTTAVINDVVNTPPVADANGPYSALAGETITFDGSGSSDLDGTIDSYDWDFGDGNTGTGVAPTHSYTEAGTFTVTLTVTDDGGLFDT